MKIAMIGAGYVGLTTSACLAHFGNQVTCIDVDADRIEALNNAQVPIYEPGLSELIAQGVAARNLSFASDPEAVVAEADAVFLAVGTPALPDGSTDLSFVLDAAKTLAPIMADNAVLVIKSTVPAGSASRVREQVLKARDGRALPVASNPEFLREGSAISDFLNPDRVVIGADDGQARALLEELYAPLVDRTSLLITSTVDAELIKYAANAFLAVKIGFINDMADLCEAAGGDVRKVAAGMGLDRRIGSAFLEAGPGFGGSCFPKDTRSLAATGRAFDAPQALVENLIARNQERKERAAARVLEHLQDMDGHVVAVLGTAFKAETDDVRESASLTVIEALLRKGIDVHVHDPRAERPTRSLLPSIVWHGCPYDAAQGADLVVLLTEWDQYRSLDFARLKRVMSGNTILDFRNLLDDESAYLSGIRLIPIGRRPGPMPKTSIGQGGGRAMPELAASPT